MLDRRVALPLGGDQLGHVVGQPEQIEGIAVEGQHDHRAPAYPAQFPQPLVGVGPLVHGDHGHRGVEAGIGERQVLGGGIDRRPRCAGRCARIDADGSTAVTARSSGS